MHTNRFYTIILPVMLLLIACTSCKKKELNTFSGEAGVYFKYGNNLALIEYSFLGNPNSEAIVKVPVQVMGDKANVDRQFKVEVVKDTNTTATDNMYQIVEAVIKAGKMTDSLRIKLFNVPELTTKKVQIKLRLMAGGDFRVGGAIEADTFIVSWSNKVVVPSWTYFRFFFTTAGSTAAYRLVVQTTGLLTLTVQQYSALGPVGAQSLGTQFGDYVKQWNKDHPSEKLKHDDGTLAGQDMVPLYYTKSKYD